MVCYYIYNCKIIDIYLSNDFLWIALVLVCRKDICLSMSKMCDYLFLVWF